MPRKMTRNKNEIPEELPASPASVVCPRCNAKPGSDCLVTGSGLAVVHLERVRAASQLNAAKTKKRRQINATSARSKKR
jgi:hypothetical protein